MPTVLSVNIDSCAHSLVTQLFGKTRLRDSFEPIWKRDCTIVTFSETRLCVWLQSGRRQYVRFYVLRQVACIRETN